MATETERNAGIAWNLSTCLGADEWQWDRSGAGQPAVASGVMSGSRRREAPFDTDDRGRRKLHKPCEDSAFLNARRAHTLKLLLNGARHVYSQKQAQAQPLQDRQGQAWGAERPTEYCGGMSCECSSPEARPQRSQAPTADNFRVRSLDTWLGARAEPAAGGMPDARDSKSGMDWAAGGLPTQVPEAELKGHGWGAAMQAEVAANSGKCDSCGRCDGLSWEDCRNDAFLERPEGAICIDCYSNSTMADA